MKDTVRTESRPGRASVWDGYTEKQSRTEQHPTQEGADYLSARTEWFLQSRSDASGKVLKGVYARAAAHRRKLELEGTPGGPGTVNWTPLGPSAIEAGPSVESGRINAIALGPGGTRIYVAAANGGVWGSPDGGGAWTPLDDYTTSPSVSRPGYVADSLAIGAIAARFGLSASGDELFVGTGDANGGYFGVGIRHLTGGVWSLEATNLASYPIFALVIDPDDVTPTNVYAATLGGLYRRPTSGSLNAWAHVTSPSFTNPSSAASDFVAAGSGPSKMFYVAFNGDKVYRSPDGVTWTPLAGLSAKDSMGNALRIALGASESSPGVVYALLSDGSLYRLSGNTFYPVPGLPANVLFPGGQGWYDIVVAVDPSDPNTVYLGGDRYAVFKGTITGSAGTFTFPFNPANATTPWLDPTWIGRGVHADVHSITFGLTVSGTAHDPSNVWIGCDGGLYQSTASGAVGSFQPRNLGIAITQFNYVAHRADTDAMLFAGAQDNGTPRLLSEQAALDTAGGDGGGVAIDPADPYRAMKQYFRGTLGVTLDGGQAWAGLVFPPETVSPAQDSAAQSEWQKTGFVAPVVASPPGVSPTMVAFGTFRLWLSTDWGLTWVTLPTGTNPYVPATPDLAQDSIDGQMITAIAFASATRLYAGTYKTICRYDKSGTTWTKTVIPTTGLPSPFYYITALAVENATTGTLYAAIGFGGAHLYYFDGTSWSVAMPTSVVDVPTSAVAVDPANPNVVYVGTDVGCWKGLKSGANWTWTLFSQGLPEAAIMHLAIHPVARLLRAATYGRGAWEIPLDATAGQDPDIYARANYADSGRMFGGSRGTWLEGALDPTHKGNVLYHWMSADIKVRRTSLAGLPPLGSPVSFLDFAVNIGDYVDTTTQMETGDTAGVDRVFVEVHNRSVVTALPGAQVKVLLLEADASAGLPALPSGFAAHINAGDAGNTWLSGTGWRFVDPTTPYRTLPGILDPRTPQVVEFLLDFSGLGLPSGHDHVCLAAFITTPADPITAAVTDLNQATMTDKHIVHRNVHLVAAGSRPIAQGGPWWHEPQTSIIDFHNSGKKDAIVSIVFDREQFPGHLSVMLPKLNDLGNPQLSGFRVETRSTLEGVIRTAVGEWLEQAGRALERIGERLESDPAEVVVGNRRERKLRRLERLDRDHVLIAENTVGKPVMTGVHIPAGGYITAAFTVQAPAAAVPGERFRIDVLQRVGERLVGGSTYVIAVMKQAPR